MRKFLLNICVYSIIIILINVVLFTIVRSVSSRDYFDVDLKCKVFLLADSHGYALGRMPAGGQVFNFSAESESYFDIKRKLLFLIRNTKVERVFISADNHMLSTYRDRISNADKSAYFSDMSDYDNPFFYWKEKYCRAYIPFCNPKTKNIVQKYIEFHTSEQPVIQDVLAWKDLAEDARIQSIESRVARQFPAALPSRRLQTSLDEIILLCRNNNIELVGIKFPVTPDYRQAIGDVNFGVETQLIKSGIEVLDYSQLYPAQDSLFRDQDHLNVKGGELFVKKLMPVLLSNI